MRMRRRLVLLSLVFFVTGVVSVQAQERAVPEVLFGPTELGMDHPAAVSLKRVGGGTMDRLAIYRPGAEPSVSFLDATTGAWARNLFKVQIAPVAIRNPFSGVAFGSGADDEVLLGALLKNGDVVYMLDGAVVYGAPGLPAGFQPSDLQEPAVAIDGDLYAVVEDGERSAVVQFIRSRTGNFDRSHYFVEVPTVARPRRIAGDTQTGLVVVGEEATEADGQRWTYASLPERLGYPAFGTMAHGLTGVLPLLDAGALRWLQADGTTYQFSPSACAEGPLGARPVLADLDADRRLDVVVTGGACLAAYSQEGDLVAGFPVALPAPSVAQPLVADLNADGALDVLVASTDGYVSAFGPDGRPLEGFPIHLDASLEATPLLSRQGEGAHLYVVTEEGEAWAWRLPAVGEIVWGGVYGAPANSSVVGGPTPVAAEPTRPPEPQPDRPLLDPEGTYAWPNPARGGTTTFRVVTGEPTAIVVSVVDLAGRLVHERRVRSESSPVTEVSWVVDVPSGTYLARIVARTDDGREASTWLRLAVVR